MPQICTREEFLSLRVPALAILRVAALGDIVALEPIIRYAKKQYPQYKIIWLLKDDFIEILEVHPFIDYILPVDNLEQATLLTKKFLEGQDRKVINLNFSMAFCCDTGNFVENDNNPSISIKNYYNHGGLLEIFSQVAKLPKLSDQPLFFLNSARIPPILPENFVVIHCLSRDPSRNWDPQKWKKLAYSLIAQNIDVVEIGFTPIISSKNKRYHDFTQIRSIQILAHILSKSQFFFGIDSGFAHIANALHVNGVVIMGKFYKFTHHIPYTGFHAQNHIIRNENENAFAVPYEDVLAFYMKNR